MFKLATWASLDDCICILRSLMQFEHSYGLGGESLHETFTVCTMHLLTARSLSTLVTPHDAILQCVSVHRVSQVHKLP